MVTYWQILASYAAVVLVEAYGSYREGWLFEWQVRRRRPVPEKFLDLWHHWGIQSDWWLVNPTVSYIIWCHQTAWSTGDFVVALSAVSLASLPVVNAWVDDNVPSALARNGSVTIPGGILHYLYMPFSIAPITLYYVRPAYIDRNEILAITGILMIHWAIGLIQPAWHVHHRVHRQAIALTAVGWAALIMAAVRLLYFA
jgi:hypothetical protein